MQKNEAVSLLEKMNIKLKQRTTLLINGVEFEFNLDNAAYNALINEIDSNNKLTPMKDYLLAIVRADQRAELSELLFSVPSLAVQLAGKVNDVLIPKVEITVKN